VNNSGYFFEVVGAHCFAVLFFVEKTSNVSEVLTSSVVSQRDIDAARRHSEKLQVKPIERCPAGRGSSFV
jgi:hypothetical protein